MILITQDLVHHINVIVQLLLTVRIDKHFKYTRFSQPIWMKKTYKYNVKAKASKLCWSCVLCKISSCSLKVLSLTMYKTNFRGRYDMVIDHLGKKKELIWCQKGFAASISILSYCWQSGCYQHFLLKKQYKII